MVEEVELSEIYSVSTTPTLRRTKSGSSRLMLQASKKQAEHPFTTRGTIVGIILTCADVALDVPAWQEAREG